MHYVAVYEILSCMTLMRGSKPEIYPIAQLEIKKMTCNMGPYWSAQLAISQETAQFCKLFNAL